MIIFRWLLVLMALVAAAGLPMTAQSQSGTTGSVGGAATELPTQGTVTQGGRVVGWATGAKRKDQSIEFEAITNTKQLDPGRALDFAGYRLAVVQVRFVRYPNQDAAAGPSFENVLAEIKGPAGN
jgi:hypothetical protein